MATEQRPAELPELRRALTLLEREDPTCPTVRQHALKHTRTAMLLLCGSPETTVLGACGLPECYERAPKVFGRKASSPE